MTHSNGAVWHARNRTCVFKIAFCGILFLLFMGTTGDAAEGSADRVEEVEPSRLEMKTERVIVFKDGYCLVVKQASATTDANGVVFTDEVPDSATLGSFWVVPEKGAIKSTVAGWIDSTSETTTEVNCTNPVEVIKANLGKECSFQVGEETLEGRLLKLLTNDALAAPAFVPPSAHLSGLASPIATRTRVTTTTRSSVTGNFFLVRTKAGDKMIAVNAVRNLTIENMNSLIEHTVSTTTKHKRLSMKFTEADKQVRLNVMYFRPDVRWIPTYRLNLTDNPVAAKKVAGASPQKIAEIDLQGEILNEAEDLIDVPIHVVVGVPNFRFRSVPSPMVLEGAMRNLLAQAAPQIMGNAFNNFSNGLYTQRAGEFQSNRAAGNNARSTVELPAELSGSGGNDLYVYELPPMTLKKGERAMVPILRTEVPYRDIYTWDIELTHSESYAASSADSPSPLVLSESKVWRQVELINNTDVPWTTGAAMVVDGMQPLAQDLLTYTSPGGICRVPVTVSVDLRGKASDSEVDRNYNSLKWRGRNYARIKGEIEAELANNKAHAVSVEVSLRFGGKATKTSHEGAITLDAYRAKDWQAGQGDSINNSSLVRWKTSIDPGECFKPLVNYEFMFRH